MSSTEHREEFQECFQTITEHAEESLATATFLPDSFMCNKENVGMDLSLYLLSSSSNNSKEDYREEFVSCFGDLKESVEDCLQNHNVFPASITHNESETGMTLRFYKLGETFQKLDQDAVGPEERIKVQVL